eukprot:NODE_674_length_5333_cov_0.595338.p3 type:complete len:100 gc:universal NODE_674_length_5333_cov_0.595338:3405-3704(+)
MVPLFFTLWASSRIPNLNFFKNLLELRALKSTVAKIIFFMPSLRSGSILSKSVPFLIFSIFCCPILVHFITSLYQLSNNDAGVLISTGHLSNKQMLAIV